MDLFNENGTSTLSFTSLDSCEAMASVFKPEEIFVTTEVRRIWEICIDLCLNFIIANVGIVSNILIIVVFAKQGYKESMNISMTAIAIWDLVKCLGGSIQRMAGPISLVSMAYTASWKNINTVVMAYLISFATYVSSVLAAYVAVERCLCVSMPLLVKFLLTPRTTFIAMTSMSVVVFGCFAVIFGIYDFYCVYSPDYNQTITMYRYNDFYKANEGPLMSYYNLSGVIWPTASFGVIVISTAIIVFQLRKASAFRSKSKTADNGGISSRDKQVVKMLVVIITIYVINLSPRIALYMAKYFIYEFYFLRQYHNLFLVMSYFLFFFDLSNAMANLFVFLAMSSNFRATFMKLFGCGNQKQ